MPSQSPNQFVDNMLTDAVDVFKNEISQNGGRILGVSASVVYENSNGNKHSASILAANVRDTPHSSEKILSKVLKGTILLAKKLEEKEHQYNTGNDILVAPEARSRVNTQTGNRAIHNNLDTENAWLRVETPQDSRIGRSLIDDDVEEADDDDAEGADNENINW